METSPDNHESDADSTEFPRGESMLRVGLWVAGLFGVGLAAMLLSALVAR